MRLGGPVFVNSKDPEQYAQAHVAKGFGAALCPDWVSLERPKELKAFKEAMRKHDVRIAEVGAWCNPLSADKAEAEENIRYMINRLRLAEELEAATCVNTIGTKYTGNWFGADKTGYTEAFFREAVEVSQRIIDEVRPEHTKLSFEMMPYYFLDGPADYKRFLEAVDRKAAAVHVEVVTCLQRVDS